MAAIPNPKVTMQFSLGTVGWSESHVYGTNVAVTDAALYVDMLNLVQARTNCLGGNVRIELVKASQEQINRDVAYLQRLDIPRPRPAGDYAAGPGPIGNGIWTFQTPHVSWPLKLNDANQNQLAITYLAGMPQNVYQNGPGPYDLGAGGAFPPGGSIVPYALYLTSGARWGVAGRGWPAGAFTPATGVLMLAVPTYVAAAGAAPAQVKFALASPLNGQNIVPGLWIRVGGLRYASPQKVRLNGSYQVVSYVAGVATCNVPRLKADPGFSTIGYAQAATYAFYPYVKYTIDNLTHRKRGRVSSSPAGRRSSR